MIERSDVLTAAAVLVTIAIAASYKPWRKLKCGHGFGVNPTTGRIDRCKLPPFHRGKHVRPWSEPEFIGYRSRHVMVVGRPALVVRERCCDGHAHASLEDAITCSLGGDVPAMETGR